MVEHRSQPRVRAVLHAEVRFNDGLMSTACQVRDLSEGGARLELAGDVALPDRFDLYITKRHQTRRAVVKWRRGKEIGIAFDPKGAVPTADPEIIERVSKLEAEVAELRSLLKDLVERS